MHKLFEAQSKCAYVTERTGKVHKINSLASLAESTHNPPHKWFLFYHNPHYKWKQMLQIPLHHFFFIVVNTEWFYHSLPWTGTRNVRSPFWRVQSGLGTNRHFLPRYNCKLILLSPFFLVYPNHFITPDGGLIFNSTKWNTLSNYDLDQGSYQRFSTKKMVCCGYSFVQA